MWLTTTRGFYSVVAHRDEPEDLLIRARSRDDLERLCELPGAPDPVEIDDVQPADYPYRLRISRFAWGQHILPALMEEVDYDNFKNAVKARMPEGEGKRRAGIYMGVWSRLLSITPQDDPSRKVEWDGEEPLWFDSPPERVEVPEPDGPLPRYGWYADDDGIDPEDPWAPLPRLGPEGA